MLGQFTMKNFVLWQFTTKDRDILLAKGEGGSSVALTIAILGALKLLQLLIVAVDRDPLFDTDSNGITLLHLTAATGQLETVQLLVTAGNKTLLLANDTVGNTALHLAFQHAAVSLFLVDAGG